MQTIVSKVCGAPWCNNPTESAQGKDKRQLNGIEVCRRCYQYVWEKARELGCPKEELFPNNIDPPKRPLPRVKAVCPRQGCGKVLRENADAKERRCIGLMHVCNQCYQAAWELAKEQGLTLKEGWDRLKPKGWRPEKPKPVQCCMPWCETMVAPKAKRLVTNQLYVCGACCAYLQVLSKRKMYDNSTWQEMGQKVIRGNDIPAPNEPELCVMSWCSRREKPKRRGPNGEPLCNADATYLYYYMTRHGVSLEEAMRTAPPPRLLHTREKSATECEAL